MACRPSLQDSPELRGTLSQTPPAGKRGRSTRMLDFLRPENHGSETLSEGLALTVGDRTEFRLIQIPAREK